MQRSCNSSHDAVRGSPERESVLMVSRAAPRGAGGASLGYTGLSCWREPSRQVGGSGGTGRRASLRSLLPQGSGGSNPLFRTNRPYSLEKSRIGQALTNS